MSAAAAGSVFWRNERDAKVKPDVVNTLSICGSAVDVCLGGEGGE